MKKLLVMLLAMLLLCGCGAMPVTEEETPAAQEESDIFASEEEGAGLPSVVSAQKLEAPEKEELPISLSETVLQLDSRDNYLRLTLPEGWATKELGESETALAGFVVYPEDDERLAISVCWVEYSGMCGTGVTFSDYILADGSKATLAIEPSGENEFWTLILPPVPNQFVLHCYAPAASLESHSAALEAMLQSIFVGDIVHLTAVGEAMD